MVRFRDRDKGFKKRMETLAKHPHVIASVGVHSEEGSASEGDGLTVMDVAEFNEFGRYARPVISVYADENRDVKIREMANRASAGLARNIPIAVSIDQVAQAMAGEIQARISGGVPPANAPSTIARKGSNTPLIDTGQYRASIRGKVR